MDKLHILVTVPLEEADLETIRNVAPEAEVTYALEEVRAELGIAIISKTPVNRPISQRELTPGEASHALDRLLAHTEVIFAWRLPVNLAARAPRLKWVQGIGAGVDLTAGRSGLLQSDILLTNASGIRTSAVAEFAICLMLMLAKKAPHTFANKLAHRWEPLITLQLKGKTVCIIGLGRIGSEAARIAKALNMTVLATRRSATGKQTNVAGVDGLFPAGELLHMLPQCDFVILTAPLTPETRGLVGEAELKAMKPTAYIINVGRGPVINQDALIRALKEGWIAGAGLDVFETEPLPPDSELWEMPNVIISPHSAGYWERHTAAVTELFDENLRRFLAGKELLNLVDKRKGY